MIYTGNWTVSSVQVGMSAWLDAAKKRFKTSSGETIGEVLVATLLSSLALMMLAGMITASGRIVTQSSETVNRYYENSSVPASAAEKNENRKAEMIQVAGTLYLTDAEHNQYFICGSEDARIQYNIIVDDGGNPVIATYRYMAETDGDQTEVTRKLEPEGEP